MSTCINHPDRETRFHCGKHNIYLCEACLRCRDPELFCKHRSACPIWFMKRKRQFLEDGITEQMAPDDQANGSSA